MRVSGRGLGAVGDHYPVVISSACEISHVMRQANVGFRAWDFSLTSIVRNGGLVCDGNKGDPPIGSLKETIGVSELRARLFASSR